jgi:hypothetical protein
MLYVISIIHGLPAEQVNLPYVKQATCSLDLVVISLNVLAGPLVFPYKCHFKSHVWRSPVC